MNLYIDIDGVLLTVKNKQIPLYADDFIAFITSKFSCFWLTTHCRNHENHTLKYLSQFYSSETISQLKKVQETNWDTLKTEAINFKEEFIWLEDFPMESEKNILKSNNAIDSLIIVDLRNKNELIAIRRKLESFEFC